MSSCISGVIVGGAASGSFSFRIFAPLLLLLLLLLFSLVAAVAAPCMATTGGLTPSVALVPEEVADAVNSVIVPTRRAACSTT